MPKRALKIFSLAFQFCFLDGRKNGKNGRMAVKH